MRTHGRRVPFAVAVGGAILATATAQTVPPLGVTTGTLPGATTYEQVLMETANGTQSGTTSLQNTPRGLLVRIRLQHAPGRRPAHIDRGTCGTSAHTPVYRLNTVVDGTSVTTLPRVTLQSFVGASAVRVDAAAGAPHGPTFCGGIVPAAP
jgi:hypothetical protein